VPPAVPLIGRHGGNLVVREEPEGRHGAGVGHTVDLLPRHPLEDHGELTRGIGVVDDRVVDQRRVHRAVAGAFRLVAGGAVVLVDAGALSDQQLLLGFRREAVEAREDGIVDLGGRVEVGLLGAEANRWRRAVLAAAHGARDPRVAGPAVVAPVPRADGKRIFRDGVAGEHEERGEREEGAGCVHRFSKGGRSGDDARAVGALRARYQKKPPMEARRPSGSRLRKMVTHSSVRLPSRGSMHVEQAFAAPGSASRAIKTSVRITGTP
jgi:hypothetical protein